MVTLASARSGIFVTTTHATGFTSSLELAASQLRSEPVHDAIFSANIGYWSVVSRSYFAAAADEAGIAVFRYHQASAVRVSAVRFAGTLVCEDGVSLRMSLGGLSHSASCSAIRHSYKDMN